eukprot:Selendium_serpulae@DN5524_c0_g1_i1.p1
MFSKEIVRALQCLFVLTTVSCLVESGSGHQITHNGIVTEDTAVNVLKQAHPGLFVESLLGAARAASKTRSKPSLNSLFYASEFYESEDEETDFFVNERLLKSSKSKGWKNMPLWKKILIVIAAIVIGIILLVVLLVLLVVCCACQCLICIVDWLTCGPCRRKCGLTCCPWDKKLMEGNKGVSAAARVEPPPPAPAVQP